MPPPVLPLAPSEARRLAAAVRTHPGEPASAQRFPERVALALVDAFRAEGLPPGADRRRLCREATRRARRAGALGGIGGITTRSFGGAAEVLERARLIVRLSDALAPGRPADAVAADLLVLLGAAGDREQALGAVREQGPSLIVLSRGRVADRAPESWTVFSTLRFLWRTYQDFGAAQGLLKPSRLIPGVAAVTGYFGSGRDMKRLCKATEKLVTR
jgi:hypothetical protein